MKRTILGIGAFILTFGISTSLVGLFFGFPKLGPTHSHHSASKSRNIQAVLDTDVNFGEDRRFVVSRLLREAQSSGNDASSAYGQREFAAATIVYVSSISTIDASKTPRDFEYAWKAHVKAWQTQANYMKSLQRPDANEALVSDNGDEIEATWEQVLRIAKRYGTPMKHRYSN